MRCACSRVCVCQVREDSVAYRDCVRGGGSCPHTSSLDTMLTMKILCQLLCFDDHDLSLVPVAPKHIDQFNDNTDNSNRNCNNNHNCAFTGDSASAARLMWLQLAGRRCHLTIASSRQEQQLHAETEAIRPEEREAECSVLLYSNSVACEDHNYHLQQPKQQADEPNFSFLCGAFKSSHLSCANSKKSFA